MTVIRRGSCEETFDAEEWICVRFCYVKANAGGAALITGGTLNAEGIRATRTLLERMRQRLDQPLDYAMQHGTGAAAKKFFELFSKTWKLRYVRSYDSGQVVFEGTKRVGPATGDDSIPRLRDVPVFARAFGRLERIFDQVEGDTATIELG